jgi:hypothetical protein
LKSGVLNHRWQASMSAINTNVSLISACKTRRVGESCKLWVFRISCFKVSAQTAEWQTLTGIWPAICAQNNRWHRPSNGAAGGGLVKSKQINHLQRAVSATDYRGRKTHKTACQAFNA